MGPAQSCLAQAALPGVRFRAPGAEMDGCLAGKLPARSRSKQALSHFILISRYLEFWKGFCVLNKALKLELDYVVAFCTLKHHSNGANTKKTVS